MLLLLGNLFGNRTRGRFLGRDMPRVWWRGSSLIGTA